MKMRRLCEIIILLFFCSCATLQKPSGEKLISLSKENITRISGDYENVAKNDSIFNWMDLLWNQLKYRGVYYEKEKALNTKVHIQVINEKRLEFQLFEGDKLVKQRIVKGKIKNGFFYKRPILIIYPFIPLVFGYHTEAHRIGLVGNELVVYSKWNLWGFALVAGSEFKNESKIYYKKKE